MNIDDLREQLERIAGPAPHLTTEARRQVRGRVTSARRKRSAISGVSAIVVAALVAVGVRTATESKSSVRTINSTTASTAAPGPQCDLGIATVPTDQVPSDVAKWASDAPVVGGGELWAVRSILSGPVMHDSDVYRMKVSWLTRPFGIPMFSARRLDGAGTFHGNGNQAIDPRGEWVASTLEFSTPGCWEVTARFDNATITYRVLIGDPPQPLTIGTIKGTLREEGGPTPPLNRSVGGSVHVVGAGTSTEVITADGSFSIDLPPGTYTVTGSSPTYQFGEPDACHTNGPVVVTPRQTVNVVVICALL
jgi:hypothetical protein